MMAAERNRFGLSRDIPDPVKRQIRQACGFGCVCCGLAIADYAHVDPEFRDAREHDPERIAYVCPGCHRRVDRGMWSREKLKAARADPWCIRNGRNHDAFDISGPGAFVLLGGNQFATVPTTITLDGIPLLALEKPERPGGPYRVSGSFYSDAGEPLLRIVRNDWWGKTTSWDIAASGSRITIRTGPGEIALQVRCLPPNGIAIERLNMVTSERTRVAVEGGVLRILTEGGAQVSLRGASFIGLERIDIATTGDGGVRVTAGAKPFTIKFGGGGREQRPCER